MVRAGDGSLSPISWDEAVRRVADAIRAAGPNAAAIVGGGTSNEEGWLVQRILRAGGSSNVDCSPNPVETGTARRAVPARPRSPDGGPRQRRRDPRGRRRPAARDADPGSPNPQGRPPQPRQADGRLGAADRPRRGRPRRRSATRPGTRPRSFAPWPAPSAPTGYDADGPFEDEAAAVAETLRNAPDQVIVWGERLWRDPEAVDALHACMHALDMHKRIGPGLLEVPEESNTRGLREVGCLPAAKPGLVPIDGGRGSTEIKEGLLSDGLGFVLLADADPVRTYPDSEGWRKALAGVHRRLDLRLRERVDQARRPGDPGRDLGREGGHRHPSGGQAPASAPKRPAPRRHDRRLALPRRGRRRARRRPRRRGAGGRLRRGGRRGPLLRRSHLRGDRRHGRELGRSRTRAGLDPGRRGAPRRRRAAPRARTGKGCCSAPTATSGRRTSPSGIRRCAS